MPAVERSYKIQVEYTELNSQGARTVTQLLVCTSSADLARLLHTLDESPLVAQLSVFSTITVPQLKVLASLTKSDLGLIDLKKLK